MFKEYSLSETSSERVTVVLHTWQHNVAVNAGVKSAVTKLLRFNSGLDSLLAVILGGLLKPSVPQ